MRVYLITLVALVGCSSEESPGVPAADSAAVDTGSAITDTGAAVTDTGGTTDTTPATMDSASTDGATDTGPRCEGNSTGACSGGLACLCCPAGGPLNNCTCSTKCTSDTQCKDAARPKCNQSSPGAEGFCTAADFKCAWGAVSTARLKDDIHYLRDDEIASLARDALSLPLASWKYKGSAAGKNVGYILEDAPGVASSDLAREQVDLYAYTTMVLAAAKEQNKRIEVLERELAALKQRTAGCGLP